jgi:nitrogen fixation protein FixH
MTSFLDRYLPPHVRWPAMIIGFLSLSVFAGVYTLIQAQSDGGVSVIDNYYQKSLDWDQAAAERAAAAALAIDVEVAPPSDEAPGFRSVTLVVHDADGQPVTNLRGALRATQPHTTTDDVAAIPLSPVPDAPGTYRQQLPMASAGLWDVELDASRPAADGSVTRLRQTHRVEL